MGEDGFSRVLWFDVPRNGSLAESLRGENGVAWQPHSVRVLKSQSGFEDEFIVESIHVIDAPCPPTGTTGAHVYGRNARSFLTLGGQVEGKGTNPNCLYGELPHVRTHLQLAEECGTTIVAAEPITSAGFEPECVAVLLAVPSRRELFNRLMAQGRPLAHPLCDTLTIKHLTDQFRH
tara:strand:+ start:58 stop:588 length:531 start_codon:yes stop_codon:yes gene_type:complete